MNTVKVFSLAACLLVASAVATLSKDITRGCQGHVRLQIVGSSDKKDMGVINGQGRCSSSSPNKCREIANKQIVECIGAMWRVRQENETADECKGLASGRTGAELKWDGIFQIRQPARLMARMAYAACCIMRPSAETLQLRIHGMIVGDKKCGDTKIGKKKYQTLWSKPTYNMNCTSWRSPPSNICGAGG